MFKGKRFRNWKDVIMMCISIAKGNMLFIRRYRRVQRKLDRRRPVHGGKDLKRGLKKEDGQPRKPGILI